MQNIYATQENQGGAIYENIKYFKSESWASDYTFLQNTEHENFINTSDKFTKKEYKRNFTDKRRTKFCTIKIELY